MAEEEKTKTADEGRKPDEAVVSEPSTVSWEPDLEEDGGVRRTFEFELVQTTRLRVKVPGHDLMQAQDILQRLIEADRLMQNTDEEDCSISHVIESGDGETKTLTYAPTGVSTVAGISERLCLPRFILREYGNVGAVPAQGAGAKGR